MTAILIACPALAGSPRNLLVNASFEEGSTRYIAGWTGTDDPGISREETEIFGYTLGRGTFPDGRFALKVFAGNARLTQGPFPATGGAAHTVRGHFYHSSEQDRIAEDAASLRGFLRVEWLDASGALLREDFTENHNGTSPADQWVRIEQVFVAPPGTAAAVFHVQTHLDSGGGSLFIDDVFFGPAE